MYSGRTARYGLILLGETRYRIKSKGRKRVSGLSIGDAVVAGRVHLIESPHEIGRFINGAIVVTQTTELDWVPIMKRATAIIFDHGDRTSHTAIVSRELGLLVIVGISNAPHLFHKEQGVAVSCAEGDDVFVHEGRADYKTDGLLEGNQSWQDRMARSASH